MEATHSVSFPFPDRPFESREWIAEWIEPVREPNPVVRAGWLFYEIVDLSPFDIASVQGLETRVAHEVGDPGREIAVHAAVAEGVTPAPAEIAEGVDPSSPRREHGMESQVPVEQFFAALALG